RVADDRAADHAGRRGRGLAAAGAELVADQAADDRAEDGTAAGVRLRKRNLVEAADGAAGVAHTRLLRRRRRRLAISALIVLLRIIVAIDDRLARWRRIAGAQASRQHGENRYELGIAQHC